MYSTSQQDAFKQIYGAATQELDDSHWLTSSTPRDVHSDKSKSKAKKNTQKQGYSAVNGYCLIVCLSIACLLVCLFICMK